MRLIAVACLALSGMTWAQEGKSVSLGAPQFVAKNVKEVMWSPTGRALAFVTETKDGPALGVFDLDQDEGKVLVHLGKAGSIKGLEWLPSGKRLMLFLASEGATNTFSFGVVDARLLQHKTLWSRQSPSGESIEAAFFTSPLLDHALVDITTSKGRETWVLMQNASGFAYSRDIAAAEAQGQSYLGWTKSGTAVYGTGSGGMGLLIDAGKRDQDFVAVKARQAFAIELRPSLSLLKSEDLSLRWLRANPAVPIGATVLECVPGNGALRSVKFPGYFEAKEEEGSVTKPYGKVERLVLGDTTTDSRSLWLVPGDRAPESLVLSEAVSAKDPRVSVVPRSGTLVSAQAEAWWVAPRGNAVAFTWGSLLFVRSVNRGGGS